MGHPPVRPRGAGRQRRQAAGRRRERRPERRGRRRGRCSARGAGSSIACGMNPRYGDLDPYAHGRRRHRRGGAQLRRRRRRPGADRDPRQLLLGQHRPAGDARRAGPRRARRATTWRSRYGTPFISGKDSLNNEFSYVDADGEQQTIAIPPTLLISALGQVDDVGRCVTMDLKAAGQPALPRRRDEGRAGRLALRTGQRPGRRQRAARSTPTRAKATFAALHRGDRRRAGAGVPRPERRRPGGRRSPRWPSPAAWAPSCNSPTSPPPTRDLSTAQRCCSANRTPASCAKCAGDTPPRSRSRLADVPLRAHRRRARRRPADHRRRRPVDAADRRHDRRTEGSLATHRCDLTSTLT